MLLRRLKFHIYLQTNINDQKIKAYPMCTYLTLFFVIIN